MLVYRIEHSEHGIGPYCALQWENVGQSKLASLAHNVGWDHSDDAHPVIWHLVKYSPKIHRCACDSLANLREWFANWGHKLKQAGYVIKVYKVHGRAVKNTGPQLIFNHKKAEVVEELAIDFD